MKSSTNFYSQIQIRYIYYMSDRMLREMRSFETVKKLSWNAEGGVPYKKSSRIIAKL